MSFDWSQYFYIPEKETKQLLLDISSKGKSSSSLSDEEEARLRSLISRIYYSTFCLLRNYLRDHLNYEELNERSSDVHQKLPKILKEDGSRKLKEFGVTLKRLRKARNNADYQDIFPEDLINRTKKCLSDGRKIVETIVDWNSQS